MASPEEQAQLVKDHVRALIFSGELQEGASIRDDEIRKTTGATVRAVRHALSDLAKDGLVIRKRHTGTIVNRVPAQVKLKLPGIRSVGIVSAMPKRALQEGKYARHVLNGVTLGMDGEKEIHYFVHPKGTQFELDDLPRVDIQSARMNCQGLISLEANNASVLNDLARHEIPLVAVDFVHHAAIFDIVAVDHLNAGLQATEHLLSLGHRRIAYVGEAADPFSTDPSWQDRLNGYLRAMATAGGEIPFLCILNVRRNPNLVPRHLPDFHARHKPSAYVLASGYLVRGMEQALEEMGLRCPEDVSISAADTSQKFFGGKSLSCTWFDYKQLGQHAVKILAARLAAPALPPIQVFLRVKFKAADSSRTYQE